MVIKKISEKQLEILKFAYDDNEAIICDGAVRSGKTVMMILSFVIWAMTYFDCTNFAICAKTVGSAEKNIIKPFRNIETGMFTTEYKISNRLMTVRCGRKVNYFYVYGGKDESSYMLIQGITLAGVLFDEVALMPQSFVDQAIARTLSYGNAKIWFNCNPESPAHWFKRNWIDADRVKCKHLHFLMEDNPILTSAEIERAKRSWSGVFYDRYIRGLWVRAEGVIYRQFVDNTDMFMVDEPDEPLSLVTIGIDYGASRGHTSFKASGITAGFDKVYALGEMDTSGVQDPPTIYRNFERFYKNIVDAYGKCQFVFADYGALGQVLTEGLYKYLREHNIPIGVKDCVKGTIVERIEMTNQLMAQGRLKLCRCCVNLKNAFADAVWDEKREDVRLDDGTTDIDSLDAFEYSIFSYYDKLMRRVK